MGGALDGGWHFCRARCVPHNTTTTKRTTTMHSPSMLTIERAMSDNVTPASLRHVADYNEKASSRAHSKATKRRLADQAHHLRRTADRLELALRVAGQDNIAEPHGVRAAA
jgi:DNA-binding transcriptional regulator YdaS (Cro superfamily)